MGCRDMSGMWTSRFTNEERGPMGQNMKAPTVQTQQVSFCFIDVSRQLMISCGSFFPPSFLHFQKKDTGYISFHWVLVLLLRTPTELLKSTIFVVYNVIL